MSLARLLAVVCEPPFVLPRGTFAVRLDQDFFSADRRSAENRLRPAPCGLAGRQIEGLRAFLKGPAIFLLVAEATRFGKPNAGVVDPQQPETQSHSMWIGSRRCGASPRRVRCQSI